jgi:multidrug efflux pump subunit AcrA (membrane-fusion protein)
MWCRLFVPLIAATLLMTACGKGGAPGGRATDRAALLLAAEDVRVLTFSARSRTGGDRLGAARTARRFASRVSSVVLQVLKDNGEPVKRGDLLVRMDDTSIRDAGVGRRGGAAIAQRSIRPSAGAASENAAGPEHDVDAGPRDAGAAQQHRANSPRRARVVSARQMLQRTEVRAPFDGVVSVARSLRATRAGGRNCSR